MSALRPVTDIQPACHTGEKALTLSCTGRPRQPVTCSDIPVMSSHVNVSVCMMVRMRARRRRWFWVERTALLWVHSPSVQFSVASPLPSHILPWCLGGGELHSRLRCLSHWLLHRVHSLHSSQAPSTTAGGRKGGQLKLYNRYMYSDKKDKETHVFHILKGQCVKFERAT